MERIALIGLGTIARYYEKGLKNSPLFRLVATVDLDENARERALYQDYAFYTDYKTMCVEQKPSYALIATPPATHFEIAKYFLQQGVSVIVEKPAVLCMQDYDHLTALAKARNVDFKVMFHWQYGNELFGYLRLFSEKKIERIAIKICDNYGVGGVIRKEKRALNGAWLDSGVNALSMLARLVDLTNTQIVSTKQEVCKESGLPLYCKVELLTGSTSLEIVVDWREDTDEKRSWLQVDGQSVIMHHTKERICAGDKVWDFWQMQRLESHYYNYFTRFEKGETQQGRRVHELLFAVNERLQ